MMLVNSENVQWTVTLVFKRPTTDSNTAVMMGVGWKGFLSAIKHLRCIADEDVGDEINCVWLGTGQRVYQWNWHSTNDVPALLPEPEGFVLDSPTGL